MSSEQDTCEPRAKRYRWLTRREAATLTEAGAPVEWRHNRQRFAVRPREDQMTEWEVLQRNKYSMAWNAVDGYDDQFRVEVE